MKKRLYLTIKRLCDIIIALIGMIIFIPIFIIVAPIIKLETKGKIIYKQKRIGKDGKEIEIYKFRTMVTDADKIIDKLPEDLKKEYQQNYKISKDPRITKVGKILRFTNLDELPQIINVLKGEMSVIGTRPILKEELEKYNEKEKKQLLTATPGISGYWQVNRNKCKDYNDRIKMELYYVEKMSLLLDIKIFIKTLKLLALRIIKNISL